MPVTTPGSEKITRPKSKSEPEDRVDPIPEETVLEAQAGDLGARNRVLLAYMPIIRRLVKRYRGTTPEEREDMTTEGMLTLYKAIKGWNPEQQAKVKFVSYAYNRMRVEVGRYLNVVRGLGRMGTQDAPKVIYLDKYDKGVTKTRGPLHGYEIPSADPTPEEEISKRGETWQMTLMKYIEKMPGRYGELLRARYIEQLEYEKIGRRFGVKESTVRDWIKLALEKVKQDLPELQEAWADSVESERGRLPTSPGRVEPVNIEPYSDRTSKKPSAQ